MSRAEWPSTQSRSNSFVLYRMLLSMLAVGCMLSTNIEAAKFPPVQSFVSVCKHKIHSSESGQQLNHLGLQRPDILAPVLNVNSIDPDSISKGHIFLSTWEGDAQSGPYIYTNDGVGETESFGFSNRRLADQHSGNRNWSGQVMIDLSQRQNTSTSDPTT